MSSSAHATIQVVAWSLVAVVAILAGFALASWLRKRLNEPDEPASTGFTLSDLRQLHREGKLSCEEYERAKGKLMAGLMREKPKKPS